ncbi:hypothetical protein GWI72_00095 [Microvirga tunisiensis]|uniref:Uncharacterized protein n=1 Tax=Pannonibacter tanglangensis TaxID=2750084 RepID=A0A7X5J7F4_9HYPH|nr:hypothetical protein [Pannonibacter sp. XCT-53]NBN76662.1 hypothetical protein [Pannonibacter sp. XCT-53]
MAQANGASAGADNVAAAGGPGASGASGASGDPAEHGRRALSRRPGKFAQLSVQDMGILERTIRSQVSDLVGALHGLRSEGMVKEALRREPRGQ